MVRTRAGLGEVHARLDQLAEKLESLSRIDTARRGAKSASAKAAPQERDPRLGGDPPSQRDAPAISFDDAIAEIAARQRALDSEPDSADASGKPAEPSSRPAAAPAFVPVTRSHASSATPLAERVADRANVATAPPTVPSMDLSALEMQLRQMTARIEALQSTSNLESTITAIRSDLGELARQFNEALPRRAVEALEVEVQALGKRIDSSRQGGVDPNALAGLERGLAEIREALRVLTPAENLVGFDQAVNALAQKLDAILAKDDASALQQVEAAIGGLRGLVSHVASNETLTRVAEDVRALAGQVDGIANNAATGHAVSALEQRIDTLVSQLHGIASNTTTDHGLAALEERMERLAAALAASSEAGHAVPRDLEKLLAGLIEKLEWVQLTHTDHAALAHLEDRIATLVQRFDASDARLSHLEAIERGLADLLVHIEEIRRANAGAAVMLAPPTTHALDRDVAEIKQSERRTQDSLEAVQNTVEHLVDRLATIESDLRVIAAPRAVPEPAAAPEAHPARETGRTDIAASVPAPASAEPLTSRSVSARVPIDPTLPPDHPLEPGSKPPVIPDSERPNFIAAARRAAQAAAWEPPSRKASEQVAIAAPPARRSQRLRTLMIAAGVALILMVCARVAVRLIDDGGTGGSSQMRSERVLPRATAPVASVPQNEPPSDGPAQLQPPPPVVPSSTRPAMNADKPARQSMVHEVGEEDTAAAMPAATASPSGAPTLPFWTAPNITGALPRPQPVASIVPASDQPVSVVDGTLPVTIGNAVLRKAASAGDPAAAYEVAMRFAEGHGVLQSDEAAVYWLERAAKGGLAPAQFRLGSLYEKGLGVKKDLAAARDLYRSAAERGNANAMHDLAVLYAEGIAGVPDYGKAATWFRKAADCGLKDSQYNLGILYARGIGVERNDAESYKWFALAAGQGDKEATKKRDEIAARLDAQSLAAARLDVKDWRPTAQPEDAVRVKMIAAWNAPAKGSRAQTQN
jgi:localization factor PodJL